MARKKDEVLAALDHLCEELDKNVAAVEAIRKRADVIRAGRAEGRSYRELATAEQHPLIVELVSDNLDRLFRAGSRLRRAEAAALHGEGMSMDAIAELFGVSRQRVSALLKPVRVGDQQPV